MDFSLQVVAARLMLGAIALLAASRAGYSQISLREPELAPLTELDENADPQRPYEMAHVAWHGIALSPSGKHVGIVWRAHRETNDERLDIWQVDPLKRIVSTRLNFTATVPTIAFSPDDKSLAVPLRSEKTTIIAIFDLKTLKIRADMPADSRGDCRPLAYSPDGKTLITRETQFQRPERYLTIRDADTLKPRAVIDFARVSRVVNGPPYRGDDVIFSSDGTRFAAVGLGQQHVNLFDATLVFDATSGKHQLTLTTGNKLVPAGRFTPDGKEFITFSHDAFSHYYGSLDDPKPRTPSRVIIWDMKKGKSKKTLAGPPSLLSTGLGVASGGHVAVSPNGETIVGVDNSGRIVEWDIRGRKAKATVPRTQGGRIATSDYVRFSADGNTLMVASRSSIRLWRRDKESASSDNRISPSDESADEKSPTEKGAKKK